MFRVNQFHPEQNWRIKTDKKSRDIQVLPCGNKILVSNSKGGTIYSIKDGKKIKDIITSLRGVESAVFKDKNFYFLGSGNDITVTDCSGKILNKIIIKEKLKAYRLMRFDSDNNIMIAAQNVILKVDRKGEEVERINLQGKMYVAKRNSDADLLTSFGYKGIVAVL
ncbi:hypothetical protein AAEX28_00700 [Lentisphaerota bacterium WC36G]|nr:hypothetical protein LJT99_03580 [Lentisphaerae bacterium WC36]